MAIETATLDQGTKLLALFKDVPREQVQAVLASGFLADVRDANLGQAIDRDAFRRILGLKPLNPPLLEEIGTITIPATTDEFVAQEKFVVGNTRINISWVGDNFKQWFLGKTEKPLMETVLRYAKLTRSELDGPIMAELGDAKETTLAQVYALMERQPNGEEGVLLTNGWANIFYVLGINGELDAVNVNWIGGGWDVDAYSVADPDGWRDGPRVFSRNS